MKNSSKTPTFVHQNKKYRMKRSLLSILSLLTVALAAVAQPRISSDRPSSDWHCYIFLSTFQNVLTLFVKRSFYYSFSSRGNRFFSPVGHGTGTRGCDVGQYQWLVSRVSDGIFHCHRTFPLNLSEVMCLFI